MACVVAQVILLALLQREILEKIISRCQSSQQHVTRAKIILLAADGWSNQSIADKLDIHRQTVRIWRRRWSEAREVLSIVEQEDSEKKLHQKILEVLSDEQRRGIMPKFSAEAVCQIIAVSCEDPQKCGYPISHWTPVELRKEVIKRGIVDDISVRQTGRFLKEGDVKPHQVRYWETPPSENKEEFYQQSEVVCSWYRQAISLYKQGTYLVSTDEKTGIQALERLSPKRLVIPGKVEKQEFEYTRHGTQCLIANFMVATGEIIRPTVQQTRTEADFVEHIKNTIAINSNAHWIFITDQLNTHQSESLVKLVAKQCQIDIDLGIKGKSGILKSKKTRADFLQDETHRIRFVYTPKHASWLNQIECWFSILVRRLLKRLSVKSREELKQKILDFIDYFNKTMAKPFKWTYKGRPLAV